MWDKLRSGKGMSLSGQTRFFVLFDLQIFSGGVYPPSATSSTISFFLFPIVFSINLIHFFRWEEQQCSRKFDRLFRCLDTQSRSHLTEAKRRVRILRRMGTVSKSATFLAMESVNSATLIKFKRGETKVQIFGKEKCQFIANFSATKVTSLLSVCLSVSLSLSLSLSVSLCLSLSLFLSRSVSLSLYLSLSLCISLSLSLSLSHRAHLTHNIGSASALPITYK